MALLKDPNCVRRSAATAEMDVSNDLASSLAAELESHSCPICFELMRSPTNSPMLLSPCGHTFCAKCLAVHTCGNSKKATCPYCRQRIASRTLNLSLQKLIDSLTALQRKPSWTAVHPLDRDGLPERPAGVETRCNILRTELVETVESKEGLDEALQEVDERLENLHAREMELSDMVNAIQATQQGVQRETEETQVTRCPIVTKQEEVTAKINLIEATLLALERDSYKFKLLVNSGDIM